MAPPALALSQPGQAAGAGSPQGYDLPPGKERPVMRKTIRGIERLTCLWWLVAAAITASGEAEDRAFGALGLCQFDRTLDRP